MLGLALGIAIGLSERLPDVYFRPAATRVDSLRRWSWRISVAGSLVPAAMVLAPVLAYGLELLATKTGVLAAVARFLQAIGFSGDGAAVGRGAGVLAALVAVIRQLLNSRAGDVLAKPAAVAASSFAAATGRAILRPA